MKILYDKVERGIVGNGFFFLAVIEGSIWREISHVMSLVHVMTSDSSGEKEVL